MKSWLHLACLIFSLAAILTLPACTKKWGLNIVGANNMGPIFCLSTGSKCQGVGNEIHIITITEMDGSGKNINEVWGLQVWSEKNSESIVKVLEYGKAPQGWKETTPAQPIKNDVYYAVNGRFVFVRKENSEYQIFTKDDFLNRLYESQKPK